MRLIEVNGERTCSYEWLEASKLSSDKPLEALCNGKWIPEKTLQTVKKKFVKPPIGIKQVHVYSGEDKYRKCLE